MPGKSAKWVMGHGSWDRPVESPLIEYLTSETLRPELEALPGNAQFLGLVALL